MFTIEQEGLQSTEQHVDDLKGNDLGAIQLLGVLALQCFCNHDLFVALVLLVALARHSVGGLLNRYVTNTLYHRRITIDFNSHRRLSKLSVMHH